MAQQGTVAPAAFDAVDGALVDAAREVGQVGWQHIRQAEADRRLPDAVVEALFDSGLTDLLRSRRMGGLESTLATTIEVIREVSRGCPALGWLLALNTGHSWYLSLATEALQEEVRDSPRGLIVDALVPGGTAEKTADGYVVSGRWKFVSGVEWSSWAGLTVIAPAPDGEEPEPLVVFLPRADFTTEDSWHVAGMRGTASNEVLVDDMFVPNHRILPLARISATGESYAEVVEPNPLYGIGWVPMGAIVFCPVALGGAQRAIDEFSAWTRRRVRPYEGTEAREAPYPQLTLADAMVKWDAAYALMHHHARELWRSAEAGERVLSDDRRARLFAQRSYISRQCAELTNQLFLDAGATALFDSNPMQQIWRDTNAAAMHFMVGRGDSLTSLGRTSMGLPGHPFA